MLESFAFLPLSTVLKHVESKLNRCCNLLPTPAVNIVQQLDRMDDEANAEVVSTGLEPHPFAVQVDSIQIEVVSIH